jgi:hypothetical protein
MRLGKKSDGEPVDRRVLDDGTIHGEAGVELPTNEVYRQTTEHRVLAE